MLGIFIYSIASMARNDLPKDDPALLRGLVEARLKNCTQDELAAKLGGRFSADLIYQHTRGIRPVSVTAAIRYSKVLEVELDKIFPQLGIVLRDAAARLSYPAAQSIAPLSVMDAPVDAIQQQIQAILPQLTPEGKQHVLQAAEGQLMMDKARRQSVKKSG